MIRHGDTAWMVRDDGSGWLVTFRQQPICTCSSVQRAQLETGARSSVASCGVHAA